MHAPLPANFATYEKLIYPIQPGDRFVLYTDGIIKAENSKQAEFGKKRLYALDLRYCESFRALKQWTK
jgi:serine phosphatase RsbU (regulator of sigma subunit)